VSGRLQQDVKALLQAAANGNREAWEEQPILFAIGIEILPHELRGVLTDHHGMIHGHRRWPLPNMDVDTVVKHIAKAARDLAGTVLGLELPSPRIGIGVELGGSVDTRTGTVILYENNPADPATLEQERRERIHQLRTHKVRRHAVSPQRLTNLAAFLAGPKRSSLLDEWRSHLSGETGCGLARKDPIRAARGFLVAAVRFRLRDAASLAWRPADAVLVSRTLSNLFVWGPVALVLVAIVRHDGRFGLVADIQDPAALGAFLYGVIRTGRWWRGIKPPEPKARRARE